MFASSRCGGQGALSSRECFHNSSVSFNSGVIITMTWLTPSDDHSASMLVSSAKTTLMRRKFKLKKCLNNSTIHAQRMNRRSLTGPNTPLLQTAVAMKHEIAVTTQSRHDYGRHERSSLKTTPYTITTRHKTAAYRCAS